MAYVTTLQSVELGVLGPLQVGQNGAPVMIPGTKPRAIHISRPEQVLELRLETADEGSQTPMVRRGLPAVVTGPGPIVGRGRARATSVRMPDGARRWCCRGTSDPDAARDTAPWGVA